MKSIYLFISVLTLAFFAPKAQGQEGVKFFKGSWEELLANAKKNKKPFWVDFWAPWCGPCRLLNQTTFTDKNVAEYSAKFFLAYKMNIDEAPGQGLAGKYRIGSIPAIVFFDYNGNEIGRVVGYQNQTAFLESLKRYTPKSSERSMNKNGANSTEISIEAYLALKNQSIQQLTLPLRRDTLFWNYIQQAREYGKAKKDWEFDEIKSAAQKELPAEKLWYLEAFYELGQENYAGFIEKVNPLFEQNKLSPVELHWLAWLCYDMEDIPHEPFRWINALAREAPSYEVLDTKAALLLKDKKTALAKETIAAALKLAKSENKDDVSCKILLELTKLPN
jgi:thioredoxin-related protein